MHELVLCASGEIPLACPICDGVEIEAMGGEFLLESIEYRG